MKTQIIKNTLLTIVFTISLIIVQSQNCTQCDNTGNPTGTYASEVGQNTTASGDYSFAGGINSTAQGGVSFAFGGSALAQSSYSFALGAQTTAVNSGAFALGSFCTASGTKSFVLGNGLGSSTILNNSVSYSLMIGFNSDKPTFFVGQSIGAGYTGKVGIGDVTDPQAKLHLKADDGEQAVMFIEPHTFSAANNAYLWMGTSEYGLRAAYNKLYFNTAGHYIFNSPHANVGIGLLTPTEKLEVNGNIKQSAGYKVITNKVQAASTEGLSLYNLNGAGIFVGPDGNVGIATSIATDKLTVNGNVNATSFTGDGLGLTNVDDGDWIVSGNNVYRLNGNVGIGINTPQTRLHIEDNTGNSDAEFLKISNDGLYTLAGGTTVIGKDAGNGPVFIQKAGSYNFSDVGPSLSIKQIANNGDVGLDISTYTTLQNDVYSTTISAPNSRLSIISSQDIVFGTDFGESEFVYFKQNGDVGIGTEYPSAKLDVNGDVNIGGTLEVSDFDINKLTL